VSKSVGLLCFVAFGITGSPTTLFAGAWTLDAGQGVEIVTLTPSQGDKGFDGSGSLQAIPRYSKQELQGLLEYGATSWLTLILAPSLQNVEIGSPVDAQRSGFGYTDVGARVRLWSSDSWVFSAQTMFRMPGTFDNTNPAAIGYTDPEIDVRGLLGYSFKAGSWPAFIDVEIAQRFRLGGPPGEFHADVTLGLQPHDRWLLLLQSFNVISEGAGTWGFPSYDYYKFQLSAVYKLTPAVSLQLGGYTTYWGRNALQENGLVLSVWYKF
jgi:protein XagA